MKDRKGGFNLFCIIFGHNFVGVDDYDYDSKTSSYYQTYPRARLCMICNRLENIIKSSSHE